MNDKTDMELADDAILACDVSDEDLEVSAIPVTSMMAVVSAPFTYVSGICC
jgi:hypothetical protein